MKKGRDNYAAREVIKFLEREFKDGHKFIRAQQPEESISPSAKKPSKMEIDIWYDETKVIAVLALNIVIHVH